MVNVAENLVAVEARIKAACTRVGRDPSEVRLLPVSKNQGMELIAEAYEAGIRCFGENRVQEAAEKAKALCRSARPQMGDRRSSADQQGETGSGLCVGISRAEQHSNSGCLAEGAWMIKVAASTSSCRSTHRVNRRSSGCRLTRWSRSPSHSRRTTPCESAD